MCENPRRLHSEIKPSEEVHHIVPLIENLSLGLDPTNLMALCCKCHTVVEKRGIDG